MLLTSNICPPNQTPDEFIIRQEALEIVVSGKEGGVRQLSRIENLSERAQVPNMTYLPQVLS